MLVQKNANSSLLRMQKDYSCQISIVDNPELVKIFKTFVWRAYTEIKQGHLIVKKKSFTLEVAIIF